jgi:hypothetical protein
MFDRLTQGIAQILADRINNATASPYTTTVLADDSQLVRHLKEAFADYEARNWGVRTAWELEDDFVACARRQAAPEQYLYRRKMKEFGPRKGGPSVEEYEDYKRALKAARALEHDADTAELVLNLTELCTTLYEEMEPLSRQFAEYSNELVDAIVGKVITNSDGSVTLQPGMRSMHPDDLRREQDYRRAQAETGHRYGPAYTAKHSRRYQDTLENEPLVRNAIKDLTEGLPLRIKNRFEGVLFAPFNRMKKSRYEEAAQTGSPTQRFIENTSDLLKVVLRLERLLIQDYGRMFDDLFNGTKRFVGLRYRGEKPEENIFLLYALLRFGKTPIFQCAKDHFDIRHTGFTQKQFLQNFTEVFVTLRNIGYDPENPENHDLMQILQNEGMDDPRVPEDVRDAIKGMMRLFVESRRQGEFEGMVAMAKKLPDSIATCYVFRSALLRQMELPAFGEALRHMVEAEIKILGDDRNSIDESMRMLSHMSDEMPSSIFSIINLYYRGFFLNTFLNQLVNPVRFDQGNIKLSIYAAASRYPDEMVMLHDRILRELVILSEWIENPQDAFKDFVFSPEWDERFLDAKTTLIEAVHGYNGFYKDIWLAEGNDNWGMNCVLRRLIEMDKLHGPLKTPPSVDNISYALDWQNNAAELLVAITQRLPYLARQKTGISSNLKAKFCEMYPKLGAERIIGWDMLIQVIYEETFNREREATRYMENALQKADLGPGVGNFMFNPALTPAGGVRIAAGLTFCEMQDGRSRCDANGQIVFRAIDGYGYRPATFGHLSDPNSPVTWMRDENGKNVLHYYRCSSNKTRQIFEWINKKRLANGQSLLRPTDVMPMFNPNDPGNPGVVAIGLSGQYQNPGTPLFAHGDTARGQEFVPIRSGYYAKFAFAGAQSGLLEDPDLVDPQIHLAATPPFPTFAKTTQGELVLDFVRKGQKNPHTGRFETVPLFDARMNKICIDAFTTNNMMVLGQLRNKVMGLYNSTSSFVQLLNSYIKNFPDVIRTVRDTIYGEDMRLESYPESAAPSIRATPGENITQNFSIVDVPGPGIARGQRFLPIGKALVRGLSEPRYSWIINERLVAGHTIMETIKAEQYVPAGRMFGVPPQHAPYVVPPLNSLGERSARLNGVPIELLFLDQGGLEEYSGEEVARVLPALLQLAATQSGR